MLRAFGVLALLAASGPLSAGSSVDDNIEFHPSDPVWAELGELLFFDPVLSGNRNISCAACHHPTLGSSDGMSLSIGEGGTGLGPARAVDPNNASSARIPRNAPALFNVGARSFSAMFHDGRVEWDPAAPHGIRMPEGRELERAVLSPLAAQNILPILSPDEMAGQPGENDVADAVGAGRIRGEGGAWDILAKRVEAIDEYQARFEGLTGREEVHITDIANALSQFITLDFQATDSMFDRFLAGQIEMPEDAMRGYALFNGEAGCAACHSGPLLTDQSFHAIAMPQIGPGKSEGDGYFRDIGRAAVTGDEADMYRFRTPSLRNVGLTAPYGHDGAFGSLEAVVRHHLNPIESLMAYDPSQAALHGDVESERGDWAAIRSEEELAAIAGANELAPVALSEDEIADILAFLRCLTDPSSVDPEDKGPKTVPSGLKVDG